MLSAPLTTPRLLQVFGVWGGLGWGGVGHVNVMLMLRSCYVDVTLMLRSWVGVRFLGPRGLYIIRYDLYIYIFIFI